MPENEEFDPIEDPIDPQIERSRKKSLGTPIKKGAAHETIPSTFAPEEGQAPAEQSEGQEPYKGVSADVRGADPGV